MTTSKPEDERREKRRRPRLNLGWLKTEWSPSTGFKITAGGVVGVALAAVVWLTTGGEPHAEGPGAPRSTTTSSSPAPTTSSTTTDTVILPTPTGNRTRQPVPLPPDPTTSSSSPDGTKELRPQDTELVRFGSGHYEPDPGRNDCATGYQFNFFQDVTVTRPGTLTYRWERDDGAIQTEPSTLTFDAPGTATVTTYWQRWGQPGEVLAGAEWVHILTPVDIAADENHRIRFEYPCPGGSS